MRRPKHFHLPSYNRTACGILVTSHRQVRRGTTTNVTREWAEVTCQHCNRMHAAERRA